MRSTSLTLARPSRFTADRCRDRETNPEPGDFLSLVGDAARCAAAVWSAELFYRQAIVTMPQLAAAPHLGMLYMRTGAIDDAGKMLDEAFKLDPFHVRVSNMRKVVKVLGGLRDGQHRPLRHAVPPGRPAPRATHGRESRSDLSRTDRAVRLTNRRRARSSSCTRPPTDRALIEWFSARMVGLPWVQTIGASTGMIVALASPTQREPPNWARVVTARVRAHPHAAADELPDPALVHRGAGRPRGRRRLTDDWQELLLEPRAAANCSLSPTSTPGFSGRGDGDDWTDRVLPEQRCTRSTWSSGSATTALYKLLDAYCTTRETRRRFNRRSASSSTTSRTATRSTSPKDCVAEIQSQRLRVVPPRSSRKRHTPPMRAISTRPAGTPSPCSGTRNTAHARELAEKVNAEKPSQPEAALVLARRRAFSQNLRREGRRAGWRRRSTNSARLPASSISSPEPPRYEADESAEAARLYEIGTQKFPLEDRFWNHLALSLWKSEDTARLAQVLETVAGRDTNNAAVRKRLAQIARDAGRLDDAVRWGKTPCASTSRTWRSTSCWRNAMNSLRDSAAADELPRQAVVVWETSRVTSESGKRTGGMAPRSRVPQRGKP